LGVQVRIALGELQHLLGRANARDLLKRAQVGVELLNVALTLAFQCSDATLGKFALLLLVGLALARIVVLQHDPFLEVVERHLPLLVLAVFAFDGDGIQLLSIACPILGVTFGVVFLLVLGRRLVSVVFGRGFFRVVGLGCVVCIVCALVVVALRLGGGFRCGLCGALSRALFPWRSVPFHGVVDQKRGQVVQ